MRFLRRALLFLIAVALLGAGGLAIYMVVKKPVPQLARSVPSSATFYLEVPSWKHALESLAKVKIIDPAKVAIPETTLGAASAIESAFGVSKVDAIALGATLGGVAITGRTGQDVGSALLVSVSAEAPVEALLRSRRFSRAGALGNARMYQLAKGEDAKGAMLFERSLRDLSTEGTRRRVAWFPDQHLLTVGDESLLRDIADVIDHGKPALARRDLYQRAMKRMDGAGDIVVFIDEQAFRDRAGPDGRAAIDGVLHDGGPFSASAAIRADGLLVTASGVLTGASLPADDSLVAPAPVTYPERLPLETIAYAAASTKRGESPAEAKAQLKRWLGPHLGPEADVAGRLKELEARVGVTFEDLWKTMGDEAAIAILVDKDFNVGGPKALRDAALSGVAVLVAFKVDDDVIAKKVMGELHEHAATEEVAALAAVSPDGDGFMLTPTAGLETTLGGAAPPLRVRHGNKEIAIVLGPMALADRAFAALATGTGTLRDDAAHSFARKALRDGARLYAWVDLGRVASLAFAGKPDDRDDAKAAGFPVDALKLTGDDRITVALDLDVRASDHVWTVDGEMLNPWAFALLGGVDVPFSRQGLASSVAAVGGSLQGMPAAPPAPPPPAAPPPAPAPVLPPSTGIVACDEYVNKLDDCGSASPKLHQGYVEKAAALRKMYAQTPERARAKTAKGCVKHLKEILKSPACR